MLQCCSWVNTNHLSQCVRATALSVSVSTLKAVGWWCNCSLVFGGSCGPLAPVSASSCSSRACPGTPPELRDQLTLLQHSCSSRGKLKSLSLCQHLHSVLGSSLIYAAQGWLASHGSFSGISCSRYFGVGFFPRFSVRLHVGVIKGCFPLDSPELWPFPPIPSDLFTFFMVFNELDNNINENLTLSFLNVSFFSVFGCNQLNINPSLWSFKI